MKEQFKEEIRENLIEVLNRVIKEFLDKQPKTPKEAIEITNKIIEQQLNILLRRFQKENVPQIYRADAISKFNTLRILLSETFGTNDKQISDEQHYYLARVNDVNYTVGIRKFKDFLVILTSKLDKEHIKRVFTDLTVPTKILLYSKRISFTENKKKNN